MTAITWWNLVDGGGSSDEILYSGIYTPDMKPKQVYHALDRLINHEWRTNTTVKAERGGVVRFRGFRGNYRISYTDRQGNRRVVDYQLK